MRDHLLAKQTSVYPHEKSLSHAEARVRSPSAPPSISSCFNYLSQTLESHLKLSPVAQSDWKVVRRCSVRGITRRHANSETHGREMLRTPIEDPGLRACVITKTTAVPGIFRRDWVGARRLCRAACRKDCHRGIRVRTVDDHPARINPVEFQRHDAPAFEGGCGRVRRRRIRRQQSVENIGRVWALGKALEAKIFIMPFIGVDPFWEPVRPEPAFQEILRRMNL